MTETAPDSVTNACHDGNVSETVISTVAEAKDVDPLDLEPLYSVIDPDALESVFRSTGVSSSSVGELRFSMAGCQVVIHGDGDVVVTPSGESDGHPSTPIPQQN